MGGIELHKSTEPEINVGMRYDHGARGCKSFFFPWIMIDRAIPVGIEAECGCLAGQTSYDLIRRNQSPIPGSRLIELSDPAHVDTLDVV